MSTERPIASDRALRNVMTRAQGALRTRKSSLLWRSSAPRTPRKTIGLSLAALVATVGIAGAANAISLPIVGNLEIPLVGNSINLDILQQNAAVTQYADCPLGVVRVVVNSQLVNVCVVVLPVANATCLPAAPLRVNISLAPLVTACVRSLP